MYYRSNLSLIDRHSLGLLHTCSHKKRHIKKHIIRERKIIRKHEIKKGTTHGSHVILLTCYWGLLNFPDQTGWGVSRHYLSTRSSSKWGWVGLLSGSAAGEVLPIRPDSKVPEGVTGLPSAFNRGSDLNREPQPSLDTITGNVATLTTRPPRRRSSAVFGGVL